MECASLLKVERENLNIRASSRGLYAGRIRVNEPGIGIVEGEICEPMSISSHWITNPSIECDVLDAVCILVVEKEGKYFRI